MFSFTFKTWYIENIEIFIANNINPLNNLHIDAATGSVL